MRKKIRMEEGLGVQGQWKNLFIPILPFVIGKMRWWLKGEGNGWMNGQKHEMEMEIVIMGKIKHTEEKQKSAGRKWKGMELNWLIQCKFNLINQF